MDDSEHLNLGQIMLAFPDRIAADEWQSGRTYVATTDRGNHVEIITALNELCISRGSSSEVVLPYVRPAIGMGLPLTVTAQDGSIFKAGDVVFLELAPTEVALLRHRRRVKEVLCEHGIEELHGMVFDQYFDLRVNFAEPSPTGFAWFGTLDSLQTTIQRITGLETHVSAQTEARPGERRLF
ncbi:hypothetical protein [Paramicrobacterium agarici]|uniref:hypothetical protein n=1 Tax=Paramicrobacterium agarici TaxID=630514 RepID=UPI001153D0A0|nr:hypothetical protein [Microbacterium agarici]